MGWRNQQMLHYHGSPISGPHADKPLFYMGRHAMVSFAHQDDLEVIAECCQSFCFDNGAFSAWRAGTPVKDWTPYLEWCREWSNHPGFDWAVIPDSIDGDEAENDRLITKWVNYREWNGTLACRLGVPVWHLHESLERLAMLAKGWTRIALGSSGKWAQVGTDGWWHRMGEAMGVLCPDGVPKCKLHGLRMLNPVVFTALPLASADSTNAAQNGSRLRLPRVAQAANVIADRIEAHQSAARWEPDRQVLMAFQLTG